jgi:hypothetical protein
METFAGKFSMQQQPPASTAPAAPTGPADGPSGASTKSGFPFDRYVDRNAQVRHILVGMVVIADEEHIPELLAAFANSKLRIQTTQVHWVHFRQKLKPIFEEEPSRDNLLARAGRGKVGPTSRGPTKKVRTGGGRGGDPEDDSRGLGDISRETDEPTGGTDPTMQLFMGAGKGPNYQGKARDVEDEPMNLVELAVYGNASLYERYPPKGAVAGAAPAAQPNVD